MDKRENVQKDKRRSTKHTYNTKDRHHDLVDRYGIYMSQMTTDMFRLS
jgi:hypothetical protein